MKQMHQKGILNSGEEINYAFGQVHGNYKGLKTINHGGADAGYRTFLGRFPEQNFSVIVFSNLAAFNPGNLAMQVADLYLADHLPEKPAPKKPEKQEAAKTSTINVSEAILESYTGQYEIAPGFILTIKRDGQQLLAQATGQQQLALSTISENEFYAESAQATVLFEKDEEGAIRGILKQGGQTIPMPRLAAFAPEAVDLSAYTGTFYSPELQTTYRIVLDDGKLLARHQRHPDMELRPTKQDGFAGNAWFFGQLKFIRDETGVITHALVSSGRVRDVRMEKME